MLDVGAGRLRDPQPVEGEQGDEGVLGGRSEAGGDEDGAALGAVQGGGVRLVVQPGTPHMGGRGVVQELFLDRVLVARDGAQPPGDGTAPGLTLAREAATGRAGRLIFAGWRLHGCTVGND